MPGQTTYATRRAWLALLPAAVVPLLASLFYFVLFDGFFFARIIYAGSKIFIILWPLAAVYFILRVPLPKLRTAWRRHLAALPSGIAFGVLVVALMWGLMRTPMAGVIAAGAPEMRRKAMEFGLLEHYWLFAVYLSLANSLVEEYYWRWFLYGRLRELVRPPWAHGLAGIAFAAHHVVVTSVFFSLAWGLFLGALVCAGGIIWSLMYEKQKTVAGAWISHLVVDLGIMILGYGILF